MDEVMIGASRAIERVGEGRPLVVVDDGRRENEGDLVIAAELMTPAWVNFMAHHARGLICLALTPERCGALGLDSLPTRNRQPSDTAFMVSIEAREGVTTGISAADRARTIATAVDPDAEPTDLVHPGHVFPLRAREGGVLERPGHTEAAVDLARLAGLVPAGVICQILDDDGMVASLSNLEALSRRHDLAILRIEDLVAHRRRGERSVERIAAADIATARGPLTAVVFRERRNGHEHVALIKGEIAEAAGTPPARLLRQSRFSADFGIGEPAVDRALGEISAAGRGIAILASDGSAAPSPAARIEALAVHGRRGLGLEPLAAPPEPLGAHDVSVAADILDELGTPDLTPIPIGAVTGIRGLERPGPAEQPGASSQPAGRARSWLELTI